MLKFLEQFAELLSAALEYLELDEGIEGNEVHDVETQKFDDDSWTISFPEFGIEYYASYWTSWSGQEADWQFSR